jgi:hypothetical protein
LTNDQFDEVGIREVSCFGAVPMKSGPRPPHTLLEEQPLSARQWSFVPSVIADQPWPLRIPANAPTSAVVKTGKAQTEQKLPPCPRKRTCLPILELLPPPALGERRHRGLARLRIAVRAWGARFLVDITPCQGSAASAAGPGQCRSWQGRLRDLAARARLAKARQP